MSWGDAASLSSTQNGSLNTSGGSINTWISLDSVGSPLVSATGLIQPNSGQAMLLVAPAAFVPSEGFHYTVLSVQVNAGTTATYWSPQKEWVFTIQ